MTTEIRNFAKALYWLPAAVLLPLDAFALDLEAQCDEADIRAKLTQVSESGGGTLLIAEGQCELSAPIVIDGSDNKAIQIVGRGIDRTTLNINGSADGFFTNTFSNEPYENAHGRWGDIRISGMTLSSNSSYINGIYLWGVDNFRIDHVKFQGKWHDTVGCIATKYTRKGLIDNCEFTFQGDTEEEDGGYCITAVGGYKDGEKYIHWEEKRNKELGTVNAIYVEDNTFVNFSPAIIPNWGASAKYVVRYNRFFNRSGGQQISYKPGNYLFEVYGNHFEYTGPRENQWGAVATRVFRLRAGGMIYGNVFENYNAVAVILSFESHGEDVYPVSSMTDNLFIWSNEYPNIADAHADDPDRVSDCGELSGAPWMLSSGSGSVSCDVGGPTGKLPLGAGDGPNDEIHFREPREGDEIYPYESLVYPHPLRSGEVGGDGGGEPDDPQTGGAGGGGSGGGGGNANGNAADIVSDGGCGCRAVGPSHRRPTGLGLVLGMMALAALSRRRRPLETGGNAFRWHGE